LWNELKLGLKTKAWSFICGIIASTLFSLVVIPVVYFLINQKLPKEKLVEQ
jgi:multidrug efflux pump subunit AcrB